MDADAPKHISVNTNNMHAAGISHPGRIRPENEDSIFLDPAGHFLLLADGMGGHERGAEASSTALEVIQKFLNPELLAEKLQEITNVEGVPPEVICLQAIVDDAVEKANSILFDRNSEADLKRFMGTTVVGLIPITDQFMLWFHVGDSRVYRMRDAQMDCLTVDHSAHVEWEKGGRQGVEPATNIITRALGPLAGVSAEIGWDKRLENDIYLLCSDGLTDMVPETEIAYILKTEENVDDIVSRLIEAANEGGGKDNVSVVVCRV